ncbi:MAG: helix-turn-helix domain-containing protein [Clostridia bacterium]|nr:helix-turn-helix domain-containing protein [Clostridia bacterium]
MFAEIYKSLCDELPFVLVTLGESVVQHPVTRPEGFDVHQFIWIKEGRGHFSMRDESFVLGVGEGMFMRANVPHSYSGDPFHTVWCTFTMSSRTLDYIGVGEYMPFTVPAYLNRETEQLDRFATGDSTPLSRSSAGYAYVMELFSNILTPPANLSSRILHLLEQRYAEPLTLLDLSDTFHIDRYNLCRIYKRERGVTVMEDLNRIRIAKAKRFLKYSTDTVETVGKLCGFESPSYFGKRFKESVGNTPTEYRKGINL